MSEQVIKQVICVRNDLNMRKGKISAQSCHASISFLAKRIQGKKSEINLSDDEFAWIEGEFTKICLQVNSEEELIEIYNKAKSAGLEVHMITDAGKTKFNGIPTKTCLAIGPASESNINPITGHLKLY